MPLKKRPILTVLLILGIVALFLSVVMAVTLSFVGSSSYGLSFGNKIGVILIEGVISDADTVLSQLVTFRKDKAIKAVVIRINSPGGGVGPSQEIYREIRKTIKSKKVIASLGGVAASGGYYVASAANKIVANPGTLSGSIGVLMEFIQVEELLKKIGIGLEIMKSGEYKDIGSPHRKMTDQEREVVRNLILEIQKQFVEAVAAGRNLPVEKVQGIADGRILSGAQCKELGLVDAIGNFQDAVELAKEMTEIKGEVTLVYPKKRRASFWDLVFQDAAISFYQALRNAFLSGVEYRWDGLSR